MVCSQPSSGNGTFTGLNATRDVPSLPTLALALALTSPPALTLTPLAAAHFSSGKRQGFWWVVSDLMGSLEQDERVEVAST